MKEGELKIGNYFFYIFRAFYTVQNSPLTKSINCVAAETFIAKNWKKLHNARQLQSTKDDYWGELVKTFSFFIPIENFNWNEKRKGFLTTHLKDGPFVKGGWIWPSTDGFLF